MTDYKRKIISNLLSTTEDDPKARDYADEIMKCLESDSFRASTILAWNLLIYYLYKKIQEYGLDEFAKLAEQEGHKFKGKISTLYDLNKLKDTIILDISHDIGVFDRNARGELMRLSSQRHLCAHVTQPIIDEMKCLTFISEVSNYISLIKSSKFQGESQLLVESSKSIFDERAIERTVLSLSEKALLDAVSDILNQYELVDDWRQLELLSNYRVFLTYALTSYPKPKVKEKVYKLIHEAYFSGVIRFSNPLYSVLREGIRDLSIKKLIIDEDYLDFYIKDFCQSGSFDYASDKSDFLLRFNNRLTEKQIKQVVNCSLSNDQIHQSFGAQRNLNKIFSYHSSKLKKEEITKLEKVGLL